MSESASRGASNREGLSFCTNCGASIAAGCPSCVEHGEWLASTSAGVAVA